MKVLGSNTTHEMLIGWRVALGQQGRQYTLRQSDDWICLPAGKTMYGITIFV